MGVGAILINTFRHENPSPFGEFRRFETKIGDLRESCRFDEKCFFWGGGGMCRYSYSVNCEQVRVPEGSARFSELRTGARARRERECMEILTRSCLASPVQTTIRSWKHACWRRERGEAETWQNSESGPWRHWWFRQRRKNDLVLRVLRTVM